MAAPSFSGVADRLRPGPVAAAVLWLLALGAYSGLGRAEGGPASPPLRSDLPVLEDGQVAAGWKDLGWAKHTLSPGQPARVDFSAAAGWIFGHAAVKPGFGGLVLRLRAPAAYGDFLEISLDSRAAHAFPRVRPGKASRVEQPDGWTEIWISMDSLNPALEPFDRLTLRAASAVGEHQVEISSVGFALREPPEFTVRHSSLGPVRKLGAVLDCQHSHPINPLIYGVAQGDPQLASELGATALRWGGNTSTRYNWKLGTWNTGADWFFRNVSSDKPSGGWRSFVEHAKADHRQIAFTLPMIGWIAKDDRSCAFSTDFYPPQRKVDPYRNDCGDGVGRDGALLAPRGPEQTSVAAGPASNEPWVRELRATGQEALAMYMLDNEPTLWNSTHRDVHPQPVTYEELLERTLETSAAIRRADPRARIAGFTGWGYPSLFDTGEARPAGVPLSRLRHAGAALLPWWLARLREHDAKSGSRTVDYVDVHYYSQGTNIGMGHDGAVDRDTAMRRMRAVRSLWDPAYRDESWIDDTVMLIPRIRKTIDAEYPGLGVVIGEYNFGAEKHISGGLALAEALGHFGTLGIDAAFYFPWPEKGSLAAWAFRAFRNYDGKGATFGSESIEVRGGSDALASVFASRAPDGKLVVIALNRDPETALDLGLETAGCGAVAPAGAWVLSDAEGLLPSQFQGPASRFRLRPWSLAVLEFKPSR